MLIYISINTIKFQKYYGLIILFRNHLKHFKKLPKLLLNFRPTNYLFDFVRKGEPGQLSMKVGAKQIKFIP